MRWLLLYGFIFYGAISWPKEVILKPGESLQVPAHGKAWVEKAKVIRLNDQGRFFVIKGIKPGSSLLKIGKDSYEISVLSPAQEKAFDHLKPAIEKTLNLDLGISDGQVRVTGRLLRLSEWENLYKACQNHECDYVMEAEMTSHLRNTAQKKISDIFQQHGFPPQNLMFDRQVQALVSAKGDGALQVTRILKAFGIRPLSSGSNLDLEPMIKVQITVAEVRKSETLNYGIKWPGSYQAQLVPKFGGDGKSDPLDVHFLEARGLAKILASPNIICRSGKEANFFAGGEFPIKILNYKIQDIVWKKYGIALNVKPKADFSGKMSISIETEVSSIDKSMSVDNIPAIFSNKIQSHFDLNESRLIALSGLIKNEQASSASGLPGLSRIPILGSLFSSQDFLDNRTELVVFVKPEVISPGALEAKQ